MGTVRKLKPPEGLLGAVTAAVESMPWLTPSDGGMVVLALKYAAAIDADPDGKALFLGPHLVNALKALGGAPAERKALGVEQQVRGKLAQLREGRS